MKGLEALKRIRQETCHATYMSDFDKNECCDIIEKELNDNHFYKHIISRVCDFMGLDINPFEDLVETENAMINYICENECFRVDVATNKNKLKALEIIKEKRVNIHVLLSSNNLYEYNESIHICIGYELTQEEYDLLKEILL